MIDVSCLSWLLFITCLTVLCPNQVYLENFTVGFLPRMSGIGGIGEGLVIAGALTYAIDSINSNESLLNGHTLNFIYNDTKGDVLVGTKAFIYQWNQGAIAIFGPEDLCETQATVAASLNLALISFKCSDSKLSNRKFYSTFARTYPPSIKVDIKFCDSITEVLQMV